MIDSFFMFVYMHINLGYSVNQGRSQNFSIDEANLAKGSEVYPQKKIEL